MTSARDRDGATAHQYGRRSHHGLIQPTVRLATDPQMVLPPVLRPSIEETPRSWATSGLFVLHVHTTYDSMRVRDGLLTGIALTFSLPQGPGNQLPAPTRWHSS